MDWRRMTIAGASTLEMEAEVQGIVRAFDAAHGAQGWPPLAFVLGVWSAGDIALYFTPEAAELLRNLPDMSGLGPCNPPQPREALFLAGSVRARLAWAQAARHLPPIVLPDLDRAFALAG